MDIYVGDLITDCRSDTQNGDDIPTSSTSVGIPDRDFLRYLNFAQQRLEGKINKKYPFAFMTHSIISVIAGQAKYTIPDNVSLNTKVIVVEFSRTGLEKDYRRLTPGNRYARTYQAAATPVSYHRSDGAIELEPPPSSSGGTIRVFFIRALDKMELRRGVVDSVTINGSNQVTALSLDPASDDETELVKISTQYVCINDKYGNVKAYNIPVSGYNTANGNFTLVGTPQLAVGESIANGDYVTVGRYTTTHSKLRFECERYLVEYCNRRVKKRDSSQDVPDIDVELKDIEKDIVENYQVPDLDVKPIPIIDRDIMLGGSSSGWRW